MKTLPLFYFRPRIISVDDDKLMTKALDMTISSKFDIYTFNSPYEVIKYISDYKSIVSTISFIRDFSESEYNDKTLLSVTELNLSKIINLADNADKAKEIGIIIVDYMMPDISGIDLLKQMSKVSFKKILLTNSQDYKVAVQAMNDGLIDYFIPKEVKPEELIEKLELLAFSYFNDITYSLRKHLEARQKLPISDEGFIEYFKNFMTLNKIKEYYLADKNGSLLLINESNQKSLLIVHTDTSLNEFLFSMADDLEMVDMIKSITLREFIPWFGMGSDIICDNEDEIRHCLYKADTIMGKERQYYLHHKQNI